METHMGHLDERCSLRTYTSAAAPMNTNNPSVTVVHTAATASTAAAAAKTTATGSDDIIMSCSSGGAYDRILPDDYNTVTRSVSYAPYGSRTSAAGGVTRRLPVPYMTKPNANTSDIAHRPYRALQPPQNASGCSTVSTGTGATGPPEPASKTVSVEAIFDTQQDISLLPKTSLSKQYQRRQQQQHYNSGQHAGAQRPYDQYECDEQFQGHDRYKQYTQRWYEERQYEEQRYEHYVQRQQYEQCQRDAQRHYGQPQHEQHESYRQHEGHENTMDRSLCEAWFSGGISTQLVASREGTSGPASSGDMYGKARATGGPRNKRPAEVALASEVEMDAAAAAAAAAAMEVPAAAAVARASDEKSDNHLSHLSPDHCDGSLQDEGMSVCSSRCAVRCARTAYTYTYTYDINMYIWIHLTTNTSPKVQSFTERRAYLPSPIPHPLSANVLAPYVPNQETIEGCVAALRCLRRFKQSRIAAAAAAIDNASYFDSVVRQLDGLQLGPDVPGEAEAVAQAAAATAAAAAPPQDDVAAPAAAAGGGCTAAAKEESAVAEPPPSETRTVVRTQLERSAARSTAARAFLTEANRMVSPSRTLMFPGSISAMCTDFCTTKKRT
ncbi:hypothetical protein Vafri_14079 [Volvox africanus]|uniref:Uncharacterized protein n=1 Tax=Volvox africanus TaxID=51714 RepID=A0A8J4F4B2_9CHLO|nr:hypothetical protein Vafri_14079 [Volvox africanus]